MSEHDLPRPTGPCDYCGIAEKVSRVNDPFDIEIRHAYHEKNICQSCYFDRIEKVAQEQAITWRRKK